MEDLDFVTASEQKHVYDADVAQTFFQSYGKPETLAQSHILFAEGSQGDKMYLLTEGEIALSAGGRSIDVVRKGEIFGEMSTISGAPRTASAVAKTHCRLISLERKSFFDALRSRPEFALMLMHMMLARLRLTLSILRVRGGLAGKDQGNTGRVFDAKLLNAIATTLGQKSRSSYAKDRTIIVEGVTGTQMYVVLEGRVAISIQGKIVETIGQGGVFGEMALVDDGPRAASVTAANDCILLAISRNEFIDLVKSNVMFGTELLKNFSERLRYLNAQRK